MNIKDCIKFSIENPICYLASADNNQPCVRAIGIWFADESGFYFQTSTNKELSQQLKQNQKIEVCFYKHEGMIGTMLRIAGKAEFVNDPKMIEKVLIDRPYLNAYGITPESPNIVLFRIAHGYAHFWTMENNLKPKDILKF